MKRQCKHCPWKVSTDPYDIPDGYSADLHKRLKCTIADPDTMNIGEAVRIMACHETPVGKEEPCAGWLANQLGPGNNIPLRRAVRDGIIDGEFETDGAQHERFADTLPEKECEDCHSEYKGAGDLCPDCVGERKRRSDGSKICASDGHLERVQGHWPEDRECPRCGDTIVEAGFTMDIVPAKEPVP